MLYSTNSTRKTGKRRKRIVILYWGGIIKRAVSPKKKEGKKEKKKRQRHSTWVSYFRFSYARFTDTKGRSFTLSALGRPERVFPMPPLNLRLLDLCGSKGLAGADVYNAARLFDCEMNKKYYFFFSSKIICYFSNNFYCQMTVDF